MKDGLRDFGLASPPCRRRVRPATPRPGRPARRPDTPRGVRGAPLCGPGRTRPSRTAPTPPAPSPRRRGSAWPPAGTHLRRRSSAAPTVPDGSGRPGLRRRRCDSTTCPALCPSTSPTRPAPPPPTAGPRRPGRPPPPWPTPRSARPSQLPGPGLRLDLRARPPASRPSPTPRSPRRPRLGLLGQPLRRRTDDPGASTPASRPPAGRQHPHRRGQVHDRASRRARPPRPPTPTTPDASNDLGERRQLRSVTRQGRHAPHPTSEQLCVQPI